MAYNTPSVNYYRVNANNNAIATSNSGADGTPTEEITMPESGGTFSVGSTTSITGQGGSTFNTSFAPGQYLYYTDSTTGDYILLGQIDTIGGATSLTLTANYTGSPVAGDTLSASFALITNNEPFFIRIATDAASQSTINIPDFAKWRNGATETSLNNGTYAKLERVSAQGTPLTPASPAANVGFTFLTQNLFTQGTSGARRWSSTDQLPTYIWIKVTPYISQGNTQLASKTMYRFTTQENLPNITVGINTLDTTLIAAGYSYLGTSGPGGTGNQA